MVATLDDYAVVRALIDDLISDGIGAQVSEATRETVTAVAEIIDAGDEHASNAQLAARLELDRSAVGRRVRKAIEQGYLVNDEDRPRKPTKLRLGDPLPEEQVILPARETVESALGTEAQGSEPPHPHSDIDVWEPEDAEVFMEQAIEMFPGSVEVTQ